MWPGPMSQESAGAAFVPPRGAGTSSLSPEVVVEFSSLQVAGLRITVAHCLFMGVHTVPAPEPFLSSFIFFNSHLRIHLH